MLNHESLTHLLVNTDPLRVRYNAPGHTREFTIGIPGYDLNNYIPDEVPSALQLLLGPGVFVMNRGSRIEVTSRSYTLDGDEHVASIIAALTTIFPEATYAISLAAYVAPQPALHACSCGCAQRLDIRSIWAHRRAQTGS